jgi:hypothetical protein
MKLETAVWAHSISNGKVRDYFGKVPDQQEHTVAIAGKRTPLQA